MKKVTFILAGILILAGLSVKAQSFAKGSNVASAGIGLGSSIANYSYGTQSPAISIQYERGIWELGPGVVSLGGYVGFKSYKDGHHEGYTAKWNYTIFGVRSAYHYTGLNIDKLDVYGGVMLSYNNLHFTDNYGYYTGNYGSKAGFSAFAGGRYYFTKNIAAFAEVGYGVAYLNLGLALKF